MVVNWGGVSGQNFPGHNDIKPGQNKNTRTKKTMIFFN